MGSSSNYSEYGSYLLHQRGLIFVWAFLADILILLARFYKTVPRYSYIHAAGFTLIAILSLILVEVSPKHTYSDILKYSSDAPSHDDFRFWKHHHVLIAHVSMLLIGCIFVLGIGVGILQVLPKSILGQYSTKIDYTLLRRSHYVRIQ